VFVCDYDNSVKRRELDLCCSISRRWKSFVELRGLPLRSVLHTRSPLLLNVPMRPAAERGMMLTPWTARLARRGFAIVSCTRYP